ncbi:protein LURP-one-related 8-like [Aristolochia californica]|uniref:protein LURP-one-related 8-like n=1 Tax=Aristolochia californica TaxID=171875 RepID=UPI0035D71D0C
MGFPQLCSSSPASLTVWRKSLLFHGNGYTVFDNSSGKMVFRVDNYNHDWREETFLMDVQGNVLITIRRCRKRLSILESWKAYEGERSAGEQEKPLFKATKTLGNPSCKISMAEGNAEKAFNYRMDWSRQNGWSKIYKSSSGYLPVAEVHRKNATRPYALYGKDVLTLCVQPGVDQALVMAMVMVNDAMK